MARDRVENALRRVHSTSLANTTIEVYEPSESYTQGEGYDVTYPDMPNTTYDARVDSPDAQTDRDRGGTTAEIDAVVYVRDDSGQTWTDYTAEAEAAVQIVDTADGTRYEVQAVTDQHNGTLELEVVEV
jgi:hypothetical protein